MTTPQPLSEEQIKEALDELPEWKAEGGKLIARYTFADFKTAFAFMTLVAAECEKKDHHPSWSNEYKHVDITFTTHEAGDAITDRDLEMARLVSEAAKTFLDSR